ncbi:MAG: M20 family metallopeptidase [Woeseiaceae bacterium]
MERAKVRKRLLALLTDLVGIPSVFPPGDTRKIAAYAADALTPYDYRIEVVGRRPEVANVIASMGSSGPNLVFSVHTDTVDVGNENQWKSPPFRAQPADGRIVGLGACNAKASMAVHLWLAQELARRGGPARGTLTFTFVGDEENIGLDGLAFLRDSNAVTPNTLIVGGPTGNKLVTEERGVMWVRVTARGRAAHGGAPSSGDSAIMRAHRIIGTLERELPPRLESRRSTGAARRTFNIGRIHGGKNTNVVPELCALEIDLRTLPQDDMEALFSEVQAAIAASEEPPDSYAVELVTGTPGFTVSGDRPVVRAFHAASVAVTGRVPERLTPVGASDARHFARYGCDIVGYGPGDGLDSHVPNESVPVEELVTAALIQYDAVGRLVNLT